MEIFVGTSGWQFPDWNGLFYPAEIRGRQQLSYYAEQFRTVEINTTFYHMPRQTTVTNWAASVPPDFRFAIKLNRQLTHADGLADSPNFKSLLQQFFESLEPLGAKLGVVLLQFPPRLSVNLRQLTLFINEVKTAEQKLGQGLPLALEFRHASWFTDAVYEALNKWNVAHVINDVPASWPVSRVITGSTAYFRFHGNQKLYHSSYSDSELMDWAKFIRRNCAQCQRVYCYFNNGYGGVGLSNACTLRSLLVDGQ